LQGVYIFLMFLYIINFGFPLQASRDIRVDRKVALTLMANFLFGIISLNIYNLVLCTMQQKGKRPPTIVLVAES
jgi:hypothetical protein